MALHVTGELGSIKRSRLLLIRSSAPPGGGTPRPCLATPGGGLLLDATPCSLPSPAPNKTTFTPAGRTSRGPSLCLPLNIVPTQALFRVPHLKQAPRCEPCRTPGAKPCRRSQEEPGEARRRREERRGAAAAAQLPEGSCPSLARKDVPGTESSRGAAAKQAVRQLTAASSLAH